MKKLSVVLIVVLAVAAIALGGLYYVSNADKTAQIDALTVDVAGKTAEIETLTADAADKAAEIESLTAAAAEDAVQIETLTADVAGKAAEIETLTADVAGKTAEIETLTADVAGKAAEIETLTADVAGKAAEIETLTADVAGKAAEIETLTATAAELQAKLEYAAMDESGLLAVVDEITPPLEALGYEVLVGKPVPAEEEPAEVEVEVEVEVEEGELLSFVHPRHGYGFDYPQDMVLVTMDNVDDVIAQMESGELVLGDVTAAEFVATAPMIKQQDMAMVIRNDGSINVTSSCVYAGEELTPGSLLEVYGQMLLEQYQVVYPQSQIVDTGSLYQVGENEFATQSLTVIENELRVNVVVLYATENMNVYTFAFTMPGEILDTGSDYANQLVDIIGGSFYAGE